MRFDRLTPITSASRFPIVIMTGPIETFDHGTDDQIPAVSQPQRESI